MKTFHCGQIGKLSQQQLQKIQGNWEETLKYTKYFFNVSKKNSENATAVVESAIQEFCVPLNFLEYRNW